MNKFVAATLWMTAICAGDPSSADAATRCRMARTVNRSAQCAIAAMEKETPAKTLYERLGGEKAITAVVDDFVARAAADPKVNFTRQGTKRQWNPTPKNVAVLKRHLVQLVCMVAGGPQKYEGRGMKEVHAGMEITDAEFAAIAADLVASLNKFKVPKAEQDELLKAVAATSKDIVEKPATPKN